MRRCRATITRSANQSSARFHIVDNDFPLNIPLSIGALPGDNGGEVLVTWVNPNTDINGVSLAAGNRGNTIFTTGYKICVARNVNDALADRNCLGDEASYSVRGVGGNAPSVATEPRNATVTGLPQGEELFIAMAVRNYVQGLPDTGAFAAAGASVTTTYSPPGIPREVSAVGSTDSVDRYFTVDWSPPLDGGAPAEGYEVCIIQSVGTFDPDTGCLLEGATHAVADPTITEFVHGPTTAIRTFVAVRTVSSLADAPSAWVAVAGEVISGLPPKPSNPRSLTVTPRNAAVQVVWQEPASGTPPTHYHICVLRPIDTGNLDSACQPPQRRVVEGDVRAALVGSVGTATNSFALVNGVEYRVAVQAAVYDHTGNSRLESGWVRVPGTVSPAADADATLSSLSIADVTLVPDFTANTIAYTASVANTVTSVTVTAAAKAAGAMGVAISGSDGMAVSDGVVLLRNFGENEIVVSVTAEDGSVLDYVITVTREPIPAVLSIAADQATYLEGSDDEVVLTITATPPPQVDISVPVEIFSGGTDTETITFPADLTGLESAVSDTITLAITDDEAQDNDRNITATLLAGDGYTLDAAATTVSIAVHEDDVRPAMPTDVTVAQGDNAGQLDFTWINPTTDANGRTLQNAISGYKICAALSAEDAIADRNCRGNSRARDVENLADEELNPTSATVGGYDQGGEVYVAMAVRNSIGDSDFVAVAEPITVRVYVPPTVPTNIAADGVAVTPSITVTWDPPSGAGDVNDYEVCVLPQTLSDTVAVLCAEPGNRRVVTASPATVSDADLPAIILEHGIPYRIAMRARGDDGVSDWQVVADTVMPRLPPPPNPPTTATAAPDNAAIRVAWSCADGRHDTDRLRHLHPPDPRQRTARRRLHRR